MQILKKIGIFLLITGLVSCKTVTTPAALSETAAPVLTWKEREAKLSRIDSWQVSGKIAVRTQNDSGSASVVWKERQGSYDISLMGPLGSNGLKLQGRPNNVMLTTSDGKSYAAKNSEELLAKNWGFNLPVSNLKYWIRGLPVPGLPAHPLFDNVNRIIALSQNGWNVQFPSYIRSGNIDLPSKVFITSSSLSVKIIIYKWEA